MRTRFSFLLLCLCIVTAFGFAQPPPAEAATSRQHPQLFLNGTQLLPQAPPRIVQGITLAPARIITEALGADIEWHHASRTVTMTHDAVAISLKINDKTAFVNGNAVMLDLAPVLENGSTLLPLRFIAEQLGILVGWDAPSRSIHLWTNADEHAEGSDPDARSEDPQPQVPDAAVLIYHTHNRESLLSLLPGVSNPNLAFDPVRNVTYLGDRLAQRLRASGIEVFHAQDDYPSIYGRNFTYSKSYAYSEQTVRRMTAQHPQIRYQFDIHRDAASRASTTININSTNYARLFFVIGLENPNWRMNDAFAKQLQAIIEAKYPGLSRGIYYERPKDRQRLVQPAPVAPQRLD